MLTAIVGTNWGDEGKGRMVDLLSEKYDVVVRYQGGNNAGHTVINDKGRFVLNLLPSGISRPNVVNILGNGMVIDIEHLNNEISQLGALDIEISPDNLKISERAVICMPYHVWQDALEEERLADNRYGSTKRGIAYVYGDKYMKKAIRMVDLLYPESLKEKVHELVKWKNLTLSGAYASHSVKSREMYDWLMTNGDKLLNYICDAGEYLNEQIDAGKNVLFEAQLGALRDIDFGIYPFTSSSSTLAAYAPIGGGVPAKKLTNVVGIMKAYSSCVGGGPFPCEMQGKDADILREQGAEYGAATGRPRRVGPLDVVASRFGTHIQGCDILALTKLDVLSYMDRIPVCVQYEINGRRVSDFPVGEALFEAHPVITYMEGWHTDISSCRTMAQLPKEAVAYIDFIEQSVNCKIGYISVGPERGAFIEK